MDWYFRRTWRFLDVNIPRITGYIIFSTLVGFAVPAYEYAMHRDQPISSSTAFILGCFIFAGFVLVYFIVINAPSDRGHFSVCFGLVV